MIQRSNGTPMFHLANAVDDADQEITHVIRGEDLINVTPKVLLLREALGNEGELTFAHLPLIVNEKRQKLSKRRDDVSVGDYIDRGYLAEAMVNYLATLGWGPPDGIEIRPLAEIVELFRLADVGSSGAFFDVRKLQHFNGEYIRQLSVPQFVSRSTRWLFDEAPWPPERFDVATFEVLAPLVQERVKLLDEVPGYVDFVFTLEPSFDEASWQKVMVKGAELAAPVLDHAAARFGDCPWDRAGIEAALFSYADEHEVAKGKVPGPGPGGGDRPHRRATAVRVARGAGSGRDHPPSGRGARPGLTGGSGTMFRWAFRAVLAVVAIAVLYVGVTFVQVWWASRSDDPSTASAIVVMGAAQWNGKPSPVLKGRLDHAVELYRGEVAPVVVVTGGKQAGDAVTQGRSGYEYLRAEGLPDEAIKVEVDGTNSYEELSASALILAQAGVGDDVVIVTDPYHALRAQETADSLGLRAHVSPTGASVGTRQLVRETAAVAAGRIIGYRRLASLS